MIEAIRDVSLYDPRAPFPGVVDVSEGVATSSSFSETVGMVAELDIKVRIQDQAHDFRYEFI